LYKVICYNKCDKEIVHIFIVNNITLCCHFVITKQILKLGDDDMEILVKDQEQTATKRIKCYNCLNYVNISQINENSFGGYCRRCHSHIYVEVRNNQTLIRLTHN